MRIALLGSGMLPIPPDGYGAVERHVWHLAGALRARGHEVEVVSKVYGPGPWNEYRFARWALAETKRLAPDVVHAHTTGVAATFALAKRRFVYTSHSRHWMTVRGLNERVGFALERYAVARAAALVALTKDVAARIGRPDAKVIPNGVDGERLRPAWEKRGGRKVLCVGVLAPHKQQHLAVAAAKGLPCEVVLAGPVGDAAYARRLEETGATIAGVLSDDELAALYAESDVFAHLSTSEALSLAVLEAMAAGLPLVASDAFREQLVPGENGFPVPTEAPEAERVAAARAALGRLLDDAGLRRRMGERSRAIALERFSWDAVAAMVEAVYAEVARR